ncbi:hypothetical protein [Parvibaculum sp.]|uniref:hypothetical protein n=1 Tax=Parvibaculum sp. TaxID=2024848 RepID=UPI00320F34F6
MKAVAFFLLRFVTGLYLLAWSALKLTDTGSAIGISDKLYWGLFSNPVVQHGLGALGGVLGLFVILGFLRGFTYLAQALVLALGVGVLAKASALPVDLASGIDLATALTPYLALLVAAIAPLFAKGDDLLSLDVFLAWAERRLGRDERAAPAVTAAAAEEVGEHDEPVYEEPLYEEPVHEEPVYEPVQEEAVHAEEPVAEAVASEDVHAEPVAEVETAPEPTHVEPVIEEAPAIAEPLAVEQAPEDPSVEELAAVEAQKHEAAAPTVH